MKTKKVKNANVKSATDKKGTSFKGKNLMGYYFTLMRNFWQPTRVFLSKWGVWIFLIISIPFIFFAAFLAYEFSDKEQVETQVAQDYWFILKRKSGVEFLYKGVPGDVEKSSVVRKFNVKTGMLGERPTPLPQLAGKEYWTLTKKYPTHEIPETAPYFIELNVPHEEFPYGPVPYLECKDSWTALDADGQCNWQLPGPFGLHGINGEESRLSEENPGSSGCIRHTDEDITYLYNVLDPERDEIRYYIEDK